MRRAPPFPDAAQDDAFGGRPSKSALKRESHDLQSLGQELSELPVSRLDALALPEPLAEALAEYRRIRSFEGKRRQLQFIGKLMRKDAKPAEPGGEVRHGRAYRELFQLVKAALAAAATDDTPEEDDGDE